MAFPRDGREFEAIGVAASNVATAFLRFYGEWFLRPNFLVDNMKTLPWPSLEDNLVNQLEELVRREVAHRRRAYQNHEPFHEFTAPGLCFPSVEQDALAFDRNSLLGRDLELAIAHAYGLSQTELDELERDMREAIQAQRSSPEAERDESESDDDRDFVLRTDPRSQHEALISYALGCVFGHWDVRIGRDPSLAPALAGPFDPLPQCPPGTLVDPSGLPAQPRSIVSEAWLRARPNASTLPPPGSVNPESIRDAEYPLSVDWDGILVDDPDHPDDVVRRVHEAFDVLWGQRAEAVEHRAIELLGSKNLREYFRKATGFFADHVARYTKSSRKAPIYWLLQSDRRNYGLWLYYHRLDQDTLFKALQSYVNPKLAQEDAQLTLLRQQLASSLASGASRRQVERQVDEQEALVLEIGRFQETLKRVAELQLTPDLDDGVLLSIAPLHELVPWKEARTAWQELVAGKYEWATMSKRMRERGLVEGVAKR
jgi:hypothetical protein